MEDYLERYIKKRNFAKTPEPGPALVEESGNTAFVVHRHDARALHYDLRIAHGGRLICFAVPKGFSYDPNARHLAVHTEDHPIQYLGFEGIIPKGEYGAGSMNIWDAGSYTLLNTDTLEAALEKGECKLKLSGRRLRGEWHLVRLDTGKDEWLLFKAKDGYGKKKWDALTGQIDLSEQPETELPELVHPMRHKSVSPPFSDSGWGFEICFEGYRVFCIKNGREIRFMDANGVAAENDFLAASLSQLQEAVPGRAVFDGIVAIEGEAGLTSKAALEQVLVEKPSVSRLAYYVFDILYFEDYDVRSLSYNYRKELLSLVMSSSGNVLYVDYLKSEGELFAAEAQKAGVTATLAKRLTSPYFYGESDDWRLIPLRNSAGDPQVPGRITPKRISIKITNPEKIFFPEASVTKNDLVSYYNDVSEIILPYLAERIVHVNRFPDGIYGESFYQKHLPDGAPDYIELFNIEDESKPFFVCNNKAALLYLVNLGTIDLHTWFSRKDLPENPDWIAWDLDPKGAQFSDVVKLAREIGKILRGIDLPGFIKTSGKSGLHILAPVIATYTYEQTRMFAESVARIIVQENGKIATVERNIASRGKRVYIDFLQNRKGQTLVPPYSVRPVPAASVSMPIEWEELDSGLGVESFTIKTARDRIAKKGDLFGRMLPGKGDLASAIKKLESFYFKE